MRSHFVGWLLAMSVAAVPQQPAVQNAKVETQAVTTLARDIGALGGGPDVTWIGWRVPMVAGDRDLCSTWRTGDISSRGEVLEGLSRGTTPVFPPATGPLPLEAGTNLLVLVRATQGQIERVRTTGDNCPIDGGGKKLVWLTGVTPAASLAFLDGLVQSNMAGNGAPQAVGRSAVDAIALHADTGADAVLTRLLSPTLDRSWRTQAAHWMARTRGAAGAERLIGMLGGETDGSFRRTLVSALSQVHEGRIVSLFESLARTDKDAGVRGEALYWYAQRAGVTGISQVLGLTEKEPDEGAQRRALSSIARLPGGQGLPSLIQLARTTQNPPVKRNAIRVLSESDDPRVVTYLEGIVKGTN
ncbi:MAG: HEAT repeat domain-containing protein [Vicinamibacterales bacterium]